jgi:hypothetical protein
LAAGNLGNVDGHLRVAGRRRERQDHRKRTGKTVSHLAISLPVEKSSESSTRAGEGERARRAVTFSPPLITSFESSSRSNFFLKHDVFRPAFARRPKLTLRQYRKLD